ncbi:MAG: DUF3011 domain-containing protein [Polymorphobacter sp.]
MLKWMSLVLASFAALLAVATPAQAQNSDRIRCESRNYQPNQCAVTNIIDARIVERLGGNCRQGSDWRFDRRSIFVTNGCRAIFEVRYDNYGGGGGYPGGGYPGGGYPGGQTIRCESQDYRVQRCGADTRGGVRINRVIGNARCTEGQSWGWDRNGVWVSNGCRAEFIVGAGGSGGGGGGYPGGGGGGYPSGQIIECSSRNYQPERCSARINSGVQIDRVLGGECIQGRSWGWDRSGIWVNNGCRARFRVY